MNKQSKPFAKKSLGQNFLNDEKVVSRIVEAVGLNGDEVVLEIGPGRGALTQLLSENSRKLILIEKDDRFAAELVDRFQSSPKIKIFNSDFLEFDLSELGSEKGKIKVVGNLPYNVGTAILQKLSRHRNLFELGVFMLQKEVVERITAPVSSPDRGFLSVISQFSFDAKKLFDVSPEAFRPRPKVTSSVVQLVPTERQVSSDVENLFMAVVSAGFLQRRKTILNNLKTFGGRSGEEIIHCLEQSEISNDRRAESLSVDEWIRLATSLSRNPQDLN